MADYQIEAEKISVSLICRPARSSDKEQILELSSRIWDGQDYIRHVWDAWLAERYGTFCVAEASERVVGLGKLTRLSEEDWWLEGLRVHPDFQSCGIGRYIHEYLLGCWRRHGGGTLRLLAHCNRVKVHQLCARDGFVKIGELSTGSASALAGPAVDFKRLDEADIDEAFPIMKNSPIIGLTYGMIDLSWRWGRPQREHLEAAVRQGRAWWRQASGRPGVLLTMWEDYGYGEERYAQLGSLACSEAYLAEALLEFRRLAGQLGYVKATWTAPLHTVIEQAMTTGGYRRAKNDIEYLFEKTT